MGTAACAPAPAENCSAVVKSSVTGYSLQKESRNLYLYINFIVCFIKCT